MPDPPPDPPIPRIHGNRHTLVSSCDEDNEDNGMSSGSEDDGVGGVAKDRAAAAAASTCSHDDLYDAQADEEDAAYVYRHLRSGVPETVRVVVPGDNSTDSGTSRPTGSATAAQTISAYHPRNSDAVLSCPCCFQIVCMDCQQHE
jgi:hypothetical protein